MALEERQPKLEALRMQSVNSPDLVSERLYGLIVSCVYTILWSGFDEDTNLISLASKHDDSLNHGTGVDDALHRSRDRLLPRSQNDHIISPPHTIAKIEYEQNKAWIPEKQTYIFHISFVGCFTNKSAVA